MCPVYLAERGAVKRVLGKDETPDSNSGLGSFCRTLPVHTLFYLLSSERNPFKIRVSR